MPASLVQAIVMLLPCVSELLGSGSVNCVTKIDKRKLNESI